MAHQVGKEETGETVQHTYFLDKESAIAQYQLAQEVSYDNGETLRQFCYYNGSDSEPMVNVETPYLVNLPASKLVDFLREFLAYPLPTHVEMGGEGSEQAKEAEREILARFKSIQSERNARIDDALFTQPVMAEWMAKQQLKFYCFNALIPAIQICYVIGDPPQGKALPKNLIYLPEDRMPETLIETGGRNPQILVHSPFDTPELRAQGEQFLLYISEQFKAYQREYTEVLAEQCRQWVPDWQQKPWRVLMPRFRYRKLLGDAQEKMIEAFRAVGLEVCVVEDSPYTVFTRSTIVEQYLKCQPHFTFNIDILSQDYLNDQVYNVVWWHDITVEHDPINKGLARERTLHYVVEEILYDRLKTYHAKVVNYQPLCVDETIFYPPAPETERRDVIAFVGLSYLNRVKQFGHQYGQADLDKVLADFKDLFYETDLTPLARHDKLKAYIAHHQSRYDDQALMELWTHVNRREILHTLIQKGDKEIEVYGTDWRQDPVVAPYFKGYIEPGKPLADLYRQVKYCLSVQPYMVGHQRLGEIAACGAIPLVHWTPNRIESIDYEEEIVAFSTPDQLIELLKNLPTEPLSHEKILYHFSYHRFAESILAQIQALVEPATSDSGH